MRGIYVHVPFCARACPYCDFDFQVGRAPDAAGFVAGLERELVARAQEMAEWTCPEEHGGSGMSEGIWSTVYLGGGTPSLLGPAGLGLLGEWLARRFPGVGGGEFTVEVNPEHGDPALYSAVRAIGGTRVSLGTQSLELEGLRTLGRVHTPAQALASVAAAAAAGLRVSADLIVGWPGQTAAGVAADVRGLVDAGAEHVSVYALTIEADTPWPTLVRRGKRRLPDSDHQADMLAAAEQALTGAGLQHYEVASYARAGAEARHNLLYWTWQDYLGLGPSAHSARYFADGAVLRRGNLRGLPAWVNDPGTPAEAERLTPEAAATEGLWTGLRDLRGLDVAAYLRRFPAVTRAWVEARVRRQVTRGNLEWADEGRVLRIAPGRWYWHDAVAADLLA
ncbi:coproporphyrinogen-III oxidase family protein [Nannocystis sp. SCPEA4]|uniref:coproporphyrinogen-III oxidase family protein n=1 Tax=Nannocystis sp. SCPEA4 TaxID=2996787 RepID=UPI00226DA5D7|nr:coproporphyrinogen-III oxidase family protein [Nannocystis sp. SCPEA4]MCY1053885.1 coproporphyrinogen-III oxidase family protein [Nannocystis sp. SCPEA4]